MGFFSVRLFCLMAVSGLFLPSGALSGEVKAAKVPKAERPNVVWIIADDLGPELGCYGYPEVETPNLDRLAAGGTLFRHAFSTSPVCSASRTALQTGRYQTTVGGHHHNTHDKRPLPASVPTVTQLMQQAGYFVSNGRGVAGDERIAKSHLNFEYDPQEFFDGSDWEQRADGQPFFAQVQLQDTHRPFATGTRRRPAAPIPPYYPEHPVTRADWDNYLASIEQLDRKVGALLERLKKEGLLRDTLIMFFGDHGRPHVRGKQWLYDGGIHTPLVVSWAGKVESGVERNQLVTLLDLMPTTLAAAGVKSPDLPGLNLLADDWEGHPKLFAARDRCGDAVDRIRAVRTPTFKYIRNYYPQRPYLQHSGYKKLSYPVLTLMQVLHEERSWTSPFMVKTRPSEELYDLQDDRHELHNLAADPAYADKLGELRTAVDDWVRQTGDLGAVDESQTVDLDKLISEKWHWYAQTMKSRGLAPDVPDREYLEWWQQQLGLDRDR